jgi:hypothetical protein
MATVHISRPIGQPDIDYAPDLDKYIARTQRRLQKEPLHHYPLPEGFPKSLVSDFVWEGKGLEKTYQWIYELNQEEIVEIEDALKHFKCKQAPCYFNKLIGSKCLTWLSSIEPAVGFYQSGNLSFT